MYSHMTLTRYEVLLSDPSRFVSFCITVKNNTSKPQRSEKKELSKQPASQPSFCRVVLVNVTVLLILHSHANGVPVLKKKVVLIGFLNICFAFEFTGEATTLLGALKLKVKENWL